MSNLSGALEPTTVGEYEKEYVLHTWSVQKGYEPFFIAGAKGCYFWDDQGKKYLDFASQLINVNAGHQHPKIIQAIKDQVEKICYVVPIAANDQRALLAKMLAEMKTAGQDIGHLMGDLGSMNKEVETFRTTMQGLMEKLAGSIEAETAKMTEAASPSTQDEASIEEKLRGLGYL